MSRLLAIISKALGIAERDLGRFAKLSFLLCSILFYLMSYLAYPNNGYLIFLFIATAVLTVFYIITFGSEKTEKASCELIRILISFSCLYFSIYLSIQILHQTNRFIQTMLGILLCIFMITFILYIISRFFYIVRFIKKTFENFKRTLFESQSNHPGSNTFGSDSTVTNSDSEGTARQSPSKLNAFIENITAFIISLTALGTGLIAFIEIINRILDYFQIEF